MVVTDPTDQTRIELLGRVLAARAAADAELGRELLELVAQARQAGDTLVIRDQARVGTVTESLNGGQGGQGLAGGGGGGPAFGGGAAGDGGSGGNIYIPPGSPEPAVASGGGGGGGVIPIIREDGSVDLIGQPVPAEQAAASHALVEDVEGSDRQMQQCGSDRLANFFRPDGCASGIAAPPAPPAPGQSR